MPTEEELKRIDCCAATDPNLRQYLDTIASYIRRFGVAGATELLNRAHRCCPATHEVHP